MKNMRKVFFALLLFPTLLFAAEKLSTDQLLQNLKSSDAKTRECAAKELGYRG
jgi:hypothetical protein